jgi:hypothetical protein
MSDRARELFANIHSKDIFQNSKRSELNAPTEPLWFRIEPAPELAWRESPGPGYSAEKAEGFIRTLYEQAIRPIRLTLPRLTTNPRISSLLRGLHDEGLPDWQILNIIASVVTNFRVRADIGSRDNIRLISKTFAKWMFRDEQPDDLVSPDELVAEEELKIAKNVAFMSNLPTWGLISNLRTPDFAAIQRFLDVRYRNSSDDIPHEGYFPDWS